MQPGIWHFYVFCLPVYDSYLRTISSQVATNQQVMYVQAGQAYPGGQTVIIQPGGAMATGPAAVGQPMFYTQQQVDVL